jgi:RNA 2',3'-cyclic 3'-phosphodiesterase
MFVAVWPDEATRQRLAQLALSGPGLRTVRPEQWHMTLHFFGEVPEAHVPAITIALRAAARKLPPSIRCQIGPATAWFHRDRVLHLPVSGLDEVARAVSAAARTVVPRDDLETNTFRGHLTLGRARRQPIPASCDAPWAGIPCAASFDVESLDLVSSELSPSGPTYTTVARIPLGA